MPAMRALLERFSPTGAWIVRSNDTLPNEFVFGPRTITLSHSGDFASYFDDGAPTSRRTSTMAHPSTSSTT
jgi:hypothetical protein